MPYKSILEDPQVEGPSLFKRITTPIVDQLPAGVKQALEKLATPGLTTGESNVNAPSEGRDIKVNAQRQAMANQGIRDPFTGNPLGAELKGLFTGATEAVTPAHIAQAATLTPELMAAGPLTKALSFGGNVVGAAQGVGDVIDPNKTGLEKAIGAGNAALSGFSAGRLGLTGMKALQSSGKDIKAAEAIAPEIAEVTTPQGLHNRLRNIREATLRNEPSFQGGHELTPAEQMHVQDQILKERQFGGGGKNAGPYEQAMKNHQDLLGMAHKTSEAQLKPIDTAQKRAAAEVDNLLKNREQQLAADTLAQRKADLELKAQGFTETTSATDDTGTKATSRQSFGPPEPKEPPVIKASGEKVPPPGGTPKGSPANPDVMPPPAFSGAGRAPIIDAEPSIIDVQGTPVPLPAPEPLQLGAVTEPTAQAVTPEVPPVTPTPEAPLPSPVEAQAEAQASMKAKPKGKGRMPNLRTPKGFQAAVDAAVPPVPEALVTPPEAAVPPVPEAPSVPTLPVEAPPQPQGAIPMMSFTDRSGKQIIPTAAQVAGKGYRSILEAKAAGEAVPEAGRALAGKLANQTNRAAQAAETAKAVAPAQAELDAISKMAPEEKASFLKKILSGESGEVDPTLAMKLGLGTLGGLTGGATDPIGWAYGEHTPGTRLASTIGGGALGAMSLPVLDKLVNASHSAVQASKASNESFMDKLNNLHNTGLLSPLSLMKKGLGDIGGLASAATENAVSNALLRATGNEPVQRGSIIRSLIDKAPEIWEAGREAAANPPSLDRSGMEGLVSKLTAGKANPLSWVGRGMSGATAATKKALQLADYTGDEQKLYTMTSNPKTDIGAGAYDLWRRSKVAQFFQPFTRMGINRLERGYERSPFGLSQFSSAGSPQERAKVLARAGLGTLASAGAYEATPEDFVAKHPREASLIAATAGPYGIPVLAGMAASTLKKSPAAEAAKTVSKDIPGLQSLEYLRSSPEELGRTTLSGFTNITAPIAQLTNPGEPVTQGPTLNLPQRLTYRALSNIPGVRGALPQKGASGIEGLSNDELLELLK